MHRQQSNVSHPGRSLYLPSQYPRLRAWKNHYRGPGPRAAPCHPECSLLGQPAALGEEKRNAVLELIGGNKERVANAPVLIVSTFETGKSGFFRGTPVDATGDLWGAYDNGLSNAYLILKARAMGFDTLIMGMRQADDLRTLFSIPASETILAVIALGYRAEEPRIPVHRPLDEVVTFY